MTSSEIPYILTALRTQYRMRPYKEFSRSLFVDLRAHGMRPYISVTAVYALFTAK